MHVSCTRCITALLGLLAALVATPVAAYSYVMQDDEALYAQAEGVARVQVTGVLPASAGAIETRYRLRVVETLAGPALSDADLLVLPGTDGAPGGDLVTPGVPRLAVGATVMLFHQRRADGLLQPTQLALGLFAEAHDAGGRYYVRGLQGSREFAVQPALVRFHAPREAAAFERWLRVRASGSTLPQDYLREGLTLPAAALITPQSLADGVAAPSAWRIAQRGEAAPAATQALQDALLASADANVGPALSAPAASEGCGVPATMPQRDALGLLCLDDPGELIAGRHVDGGTLAVAGFRTGAGAGNALIVLQQDALARRSAVDAGEVLAHALENVGGLVARCAARDHGACAALGAPLLGGSQPVVALPSVPAPRDVKGAPTPPSAPGNLRGATDGTRVLLDWDSAVDNVGVQFYRIQLCTGAGCNDFLPDPTIITAPALFFDYVGLAPSTTYRFRVVAFDAIGQESPPSNAIELTTGVDIAPLALANGVAVADLAGPARGERRFTLQVPSGASNLVFRLAGGSGDADLYVRAGAEPTASTFDCRPFDDGNDEQCAIESPVAGTYFVLVRASSDYEGATLTGSFTAPGAVGGCESPCVFRNGFEP